MLRIAVIASLSMNLYVRAVLEGGVVLVCVWVSTRWDLNFISSISVDFISWSSGAGGGFWGLGL